MNLQKKIISKEKTVILDKFFVFTLLFSFFILSYLLTPYWMLPSPVHQKILLFILTICSGFLWSLWGSNHVKIRLEKQSFFLLIILAVFMGLINIKPLMSPIPWKGDEDFHIFTVRLLIPLIKNRFPLFILLLLFIYSGWRKSKWSLAVGAVLLISIVLYNYLYEFYYPSILRYPYISRYFQALFPLILQPFGGDYYEFSYRPIPFISAIVLAWISASAAVLHPRLRLLTGISLATMPLLYYYSSILYLELPVTVLMLIVCLDMDTLLHEKFPEISRSPSWYALIFIGFIKETAVIFLFVFIVFRLINQILLSLKEHHKIFWSSFFKDEAVIAYNISLPIIIYLSYRIFYSNYRKLSPDLSGIFTLQAYTVYLRSFAEQFALFAALFLGGCIIYFYEKKYIHACFLIGAVLSTMIFHIVDNIVYSGYSRFNLFIMPMILAGAVKCIDYLVKTKINVPLILVGVIVTNFFLSPVYSDGTKKPLWGNYLCDTSEHYYPYPEVLLWLKKEHPSAIILFSGLEYPYYLDFYFNKMKWFPEHYRIDLKNEAVIRKMSEQACGRENLANVSREADADVYLKKLKCLALKKVFVNQAHRLSVYVPEH
jgi:hypothetical protein